MKDKEKKDTSLQEIQKNMDETKSIFDIKNIPFLRHLYNKQREKTIEDKDYHKIVNKHARIRFRLMQIRSMRDMDIKACVHIDSLGEIYLIPAIEREGKIYYYAEKEHVKDIDEITNINYYDIDMDKGYLCHSLLPNTIKCNPKLDETIVKQAKELDKDRKTLEKEFSIKTVMQIGKSQLKVLKYAVGLSLLAGFGSGCIVGVWLAVRMF